ncbi:hypothetical protein [Desulfotomaculum copahuensis]|uniref:hypothetical protein n=1 Tax=Desulfotomaculum copahuensis TaxID=1838280 RepID=UPI000ABB37FB|nr:hypothetical protein [Desulfotomaculum copahuensis]
MKYWYVEDAGGGCRAFSEVVVLVCEQPREIYTARVPLTWKTKESLEEVVCRLITGLMKKAGANKEDYYLVCPGNIFYGFHRWLSDNGYRWEQIKMEGLAHDAAESEFQRQIVRAGFPPHIHLVERNYRDFYRLVEDWVMQQPERHRYLKDREVRQKPVETRYVLKSNYGRPHYCSACRETVKPFTPMVEYKATRDGKRVRHYFHPSCSPVTPFKNKLVTMDAYIDGKQLTGVVIPCRTDTACAWCGGIIPAGEAAFYGYLDDRLFTGHLLCTGVQKAAKEI